MVNTEKSNAEFKKDENKKKPVNLNWSRVVRAQSPILHIVESILLSANALWREYVALHTFAPHWRVCYAVIVLLRANQSTTKSNIVYFQFPRRNSDSQPVNMENNATEHHFGCQNSYERNGIVLG